MFGIGEIGEVRKAGEGQRSRVPHIGSSWSAAACDWSEILR